MSQQVLKHLTQSDDHDGNVELLSGALRQTQEAVLQRIFHYVLLLRPHCQPQQQQHYTTDNVTFCHTIKSQTERLYMSVWVDSVLQVMIVFSA